MWRRGSAESDGGEMNELNKCKSDRVKTTKNVEPQMRAATNEELLQTKREREEKRVQLGMKGY